MTNFRGKLTNEDILKMINAVDKDSDGKINKKGYPFKLIEFHLKFFFN
jgi:hypothetical protein